MDMVHSSTIRRSHLLRTTFICLFPVVLSSSFAAEVLLWAAHEQPWNQADGFLATARIAVPARNTIYTAVCWQAGKFSFYQGSSPRDRYIRFQVFDSPSGHAPRVVDRPKQASLIPSAWAGAGATLQVPYAWKEMQDYRVCLTSTLSKGNAHVAAYLFDSSRWIPMGKMTRSGGPAWFTQEKLWLAIDSTANDNDVRRYMLSHILVRTAAGPWISLVQFLPATSPDAVRPLATVQDEWFVIETRSPHPADKLPPILVTTQSSTDMGSLPEDAFIEVAPGKH